MTKTKTRNALTVANERHFEMVAALKVIALTPTTAQYLQQHDPKALAQVIAALGMTDSDINAVINGPRPGGADVVVTPEGSVYHFALHTTAAIEFVRDTFATEPWQWLGTKALAIDHRFAPQVVCQLRDGGFSVEVR